MNECGVPAISAPLDPGQCSVRRQPTTATLYVCVCLRHTRARVGPVPVDEGAAAYVVVVVVVVVDAANGAHFVAAAISR